jgi:hypothetical protein
VAAVNPTYICAPSCVTRLTVADTVAAAGFVAVAETDAVSVPAPL